MTSLSNYPDYETIKETVNVSNYEHTLTVVMQIICNFLVLMKGSIEINYQNINSLNTQL